MSWMVCDSPGGRSRGGRGGARLPEMLPFLKAAAAGEAYAAVYPPAHPGECSLSELEGADPGVHGLGDVLDILGDLQGVDGLRRGFPGGVGDGLDVG